MEIVKVFDILHYVRASSFSQMTKGTPPTHTHTAEQDFSEQQKIIF